MIGSSMHPDPAEATPTDELIAMADELVRRLNRSPDCTDVRADPKSLTPNVKRACVARGTPGVIGYFDPRRMAHQCHACLALWAAQLCRQELQFVLQRENENEDLRRQKENE